MLKALSRYELMEPTDWCHMNEGISFKRNWWCSGEGVKQVFFPLNFSVTGKFTAVKRFKT